MEAGLEFAGEFPQPGHALGPDSSPVPRDEPVLTHPAKPSPLSAIPPDCAILFRH